MYHLIVNPTAARGRTGARLSRLCRALDAAGISYEIHTSEYPDHAVELLARIGGTARIMIYHARALTGYMLWLRYALLAGRPGRSLADVYFHHLESTGTKAYTCEEARRMCADFSHVRVRVQLNPGDLLEGATGQRHGGVLLTLARALWPRPLLRRLMRNHGLALLIEAVK